MPDEESKAPISWEFEYQNAKEALSQQKSDLHALAKDGQSHLRVAFVFAGFIVTGITYTSSVDGVLGSPAGICIVDIIGVCFSVSFLLQIGVLTLLLGIVFLILSSGVESRATFYIKEGNENVENDILTDIPTERNYYQQKLEEFQHRIDHNSAVIHGYESILVLGKSFLGVSVLSFSLSAYRLYTNQPVPWLAAILVIAVFASYYAISWIMPDKYLEMDRKLTPPNNN